MAVLHLDSRQSALDCCVDIRELFFSSKLKLLDKSQPEVQELSTAVNTSSRSKAVLYQYSGRLWIPKYLLRCFFFPHMNSPQVSPSFSLALGLCSHRVIESQNILIWKGHKMISDSEISSVPDSISSMLCSPLRIRWWPPQTYCGVSLQLKNCPWKTGAQVVCKQCFPSQCLGSHLHSYLGAIFPEELSLMDHKSKQTFTQIKLLQQDSLPFFGAKAFIKNHRM